MWVRKLRITFLIFWGFFFSFLKVDFFLLLVKIFDGETGLIACMGSAQQSAQCCLLSHILTR